MATRFGAYEILHELKSGGMGSVLLGRRRGPGAFEQLVAIKTIRPEYAHTEAVRAMFLDEAAILARLNHPGIATVHDFGEEGGTLYMVMEYVAGISFRALADLALTPGVAARAIAEACRGLHAAHELRDLHGNLLGVVHRDISPDNLMVGYDGHVKVIDFGIALVKNRQSPVTEFGTVKGKPPYMSPEQVKNEAMDRRSDVFSLAVVLYELLTRQPLFEGDSIYAVARAVEHQEIRPPSHVIGAALPMGLDAAVMNALDRDLARRTPTAAALAEHLEQVINIAGDETLEAWADRELAAPRDAHRSWISSVVAGRDAPPVVGRATGTATAIGPLKLDTQAAPASSPSLPAGEQPSEPDSTHLAASTGDDFVPARRSLAIPLVLGLAVLLAAGTGVMMLGGDGAAAPPDAAVVALADAGALDAYEVNVPPPADAMAADAVLQVVPVDAAVRRPRVDAAARTVRRDAGVALARPDAAVVAPPAGTGKITVKHKAGGTFVNVLVDGKLFGATPMFGKKLAAGTHTIELVAPDTGAVVYKTTITVADGKTASVTQP